MISLSKNDAMRIIILLWIVSYFFLEEQAVNEKIEQLVTKVKQTEFEKIHK